MKFTKMHGTGNDFIVINAFEEALPSDLVSFSKKIADRHFGVGCDQVLIIDKSDVADFKMLIFNNDGSQVEMCGNGIRCLARYVFERGLTKKKKVTVEEVNEVFKKAEKEPYYQGILATTDEELVSSDFIGNSHSCIVDLSLTAVVDGDMLKVVAWYDNEWGYSNRLVEVVADTAKILSKSE